MLTKIDINPDGIVFTFTDGSCSLDRDEMKRLYKMLGSVIRKKQTPVVMSLVSKKRGK